MSDEVQVQQPLRRIVLWQRQGTRAGLWHITGTDESFDVALPEWVDGVQFSDHVGSADWMKTTERMHVYQERLPNQHVLPEAL